MGALPTPVSLHSSYMSCFSKSKQRETKSDNIYIDYFLHLSSTGGDLSSLPLRNGAACTLWVLRLDDDYLCSGHGQRPEELLRHGEPSSIVVPGFNIRCCFLWHAF